MEFHLEKDSQSERRPESCDVHTKQNKKWGVRKLLLAGRRDKIGRTKKFGRMKFFLHVRKYFLYVQLFPNFFQTIMKPPKLCPTCQEHVFLKHNTTTGLHHTESQSGDASTNWFYQNQNIQISNRENMGPSPNYLPRLLPLPKL